VEVLVLDQPLADDAEDSIPDLSEGAGRTPNTNITQRTDV
jgi:hypothetical protein